ncbi:MAG: hypothetical protein V4447_15885 [Pseudomonadota bacterium]
MARHPVYSWPDNRALALRALQEKRLVVVSIATETASTATATPETYRAQARMQLRAALIDVLSTFLACAPEDIDLTHTPGQAPKRNLCLSMPDTQIGISLSHEQGLSIATIYLDGNVGVDLVLVNPKIEWQAVAELYLGAQVSGQIAKTPASQQAAYFSLQWASFEAKLKCCQRALSEWSPELELILKDCAIRELDLPRGYAGMLVFCNHQQN